MQDDLFDPSDSIDSPEEETESLDELGVSVRDADELDADVAEDAAPTATDDESNDDEDDEDDDDEDDDETDDE